MNALYSLVRISERAAGVNSYLRDPGMISIANLSSPKISPWLTRGFRGVYSKAMVGVVDRESVNEMMSLLRTSPDAISHESLPSSLLSTNTMALSQMTPSTSLAALADPPMRQIDGAAMDYFLIEMVAALRESAAVATARSKQVEQEMIEAGLLPHPIPVPTSLKKDSSARDSVTSLVSRTGSAAGKGTLDEEEEPVRQRLEAIGMHVGANFSERYVFFYIVSYNSSGECRFVQTMSG